MARRKAEVITTPPEVEAYCVEEQIPEEELVVADRLIAGILLRMWLKKPGNRRRLMGKSESPRAQSA